MAYIVTVRRGSRIKELRASSKAQVERLIQMSERAGCSASCFIAGQQEQIANEQRSCSSCRHISAQHLYGNMYYHCNYYGGQISSRTVTIHNDCVRWARIISQ